jgi:predicted DNA-binding transcriptional regulator AlpA
MKIQRSKEGRKLNLELKALISLEEVGETYRMNFSSEPNQGLSSSDANALIALYKEILSEIRALRKESVAPRRRLLNINETATYLGISARTIRNRTGRSAVRRFPIKPVRLGGRVLFRQEDLDQFIDEMGAKGKRGPR